MNPLRSHPAMMTSSNGSVFRVIGPLCGEFTGHRSQRPVSSAINDFEYVFKMAEELPRYIATFESYEVLTNLYLTFPLSWGPLKICARSDGWLHNWIALLEKNKWQARVLRHQTKPCSKWRIEGLSPMGRYTMFKAHYPPCIRISNESGGTSYLKDS